MFGYNVANSPANTFWASDLLHRLFHLPKVGEGAVGHYGTETKYSGVLDLPKENSTYAVRNSDTLQYFALEVYAHDVAVPGIGCPGTFTATPTGTADATSEATVAASSTVATPSDATASTTAAAEACTTHEDHW